MTSSSSRMACSSGDHSRARPGSCRSAAAVPPLLGLAPPPPPPPPEWDPFCAAVLAGGGWPLVPMAPTIGARMFRGSLREPAAPARVGGGEREPLSSSLCGEWMRNKKGVSVSFLGVRFDRTGDFVASAACCSQGTMYRFSFPYLNFYLKKILLPVHSTRKLSIYCMVSLT